MLRTRLVPVCAAGSAGGLPACLALPRPARVRGDVMAGYKSAACPTLLPFSERGGGSMAPVSAAGRGAAGRLAAFPPPVTRLAAGRARADCSGPRSPGGVGPGRRSSEGAASVIRAFRVWVVNVGAFFGVLAKGQEI